MGCMPIRSVPILNFDSFNKQTKLFALNSNRICLVCEPSTDGRDQTLLNAHFVCEKQQTIFFKNRKKC